MDLMKCRDENPVGTWTIKVKDQVNPDKTGRFVAWSLQLWGESVDPALAKLWAPAEEGQPDEEQTGSNASTTVSQKPKPTARLPGDHGEASGEATQPGLGSATAHPQPTSTTGNAGNVAEPTSPTDADADEGFFSGISNLASSSTWLAGAGAIIILSGAAIGAFFFIRARRQKRNLFGLSNNGQGARGAYEPVDDVQMSLLERGRRKFGKSKSESQGTKDLYDAFGDGPSDEEEEDLDERTALRYHDGFLEDDEPNEVGPKTEYKDEPESEPETFKDGEETVGTKDKGKGKGPSEGESGSGSSSSWQDAADEEARV